MGLEQGVFHQEFHISQKKEALRVPLPQEVFSFQEKGFEGQQPVEGDLRDLVENELPKIEEKDLTSPDGFEPFADPSIGENLLFVNGYRGNYFKDMRLNRKQIERVLTMAHLDGKVVLMSLDNSRKRSIEANPDGSITGKRSLFFKQKIEKEDKEPIYRVMPIPQGWSIGINDERMMQELSDKKLTGEKLKKEFVKQFNGFINAGIFEAVRREKLSDEKDKDFKWKLSVSLFYSGWVSLGPVTNLILYRPSLWYFSAHILENYLLLYALPFAMLSLADTSFGRKRDNPLEWFMPLVEVDKVARTSAFLKGKGRKLVKETK